MGNVVVICCFCNESLNENQSAVINIKIANSEDELQNLFAHNSCIFSRVHKSVPFLVIRSISWYDNQTEEFVSEIELDIELSKLQEIIGEENFKDDIFLYKIYELKEFQILQILNLINDSEEKIDLIKYSYYLESAT